MLKLIVLLCLLVMLTFNSVLAETTFFEGELGYRDDFIMSNSTSEEGSSSGELISTSGSGASLNNIGQNKSNLSINQINMSKSELLDEEIYGNEFIICIVPWFIILALLLYSLYLRSRKKTSVIE